MLHQMATTSWNESRASTLPIFPQRHVTNDLTSRGFYRLGELDFKIRDTVDTFFMSFGVKWRLPSSPRTDKSPLCMLKIKTYPDTCNKLFYLVICLIFSTIVTKAQSSIINNFDDWCAPTNTENSKHNPVRCKTFSLFRPTFVFMVSFNSRFRWQWVLNIYLANFYTIVFDPLFERQ